MESVRPQKIVIRLRKFCQPLGIPHSLFEYNKLVTIYLIHFKRRNTNMPTVIYDVSNHLVQLHLMRSNERLSTQVCSDWFLLTYNCDLISHCPTHIHSAFVSSFIIYSYVILVCMHTKISKLLMPRLYHHHHHHHHH